MRDSSVAPKLTLLNIVLSLVYLKLTSSNCMIGGDSRSVSGNFNITSCSFSIGFKSGLKILSCYK